MFIRIIERQIAEDIAFDFKLLKAYRDTEGKPRQKHIKTWTYRKSFTNFRQDSLQFISDFRWDLKQIAETQGQRAQFLNIIKKFFRTHGMDPKLRR